MVRKSKEDMEMEIEIARSVLSSLPDANIIAAKKFFDNLSRYKKLEKLRGTYIEGVEQSLKNTENGKIYVNYNIDGARTGRLSNSGANFSAGRNKESKLGVSFHTLPRENDDLEVNIRDYVIAPDGWDFLTIDLKACELRVLAHVANEANMIKAFKSGLDFHIYSAALAYNKNPEDVTKDERQSAKEVSFLTVYGGTAFTLASKRNISESKAQKIIDSWLRAYPGVQEYMNDIEKYINKYKCARTIFGRVRHLKNIDSPFKSVRREAYRQGLNFTVQSPSSDILLCCLIGINNKLKSLGLKSKIISTVHDSIEIVSPKHETKNVIQIAYEEFRSLEYLKTHFDIDLRVPLDIDVEKGSSFGNGKKLDLKNYLAV